MYYHFVWVRSSRYHGREPLTYSSSERLPTGTIVEVELQKSLILGVVSGPTTKPRFQIKQVTRVLDLPLVPAHLLRLSQWLISYYPAPLGLISQQLLPAKFSEKSLSAGQPVEYEPPVTSDLPTLTRQQTEALKSMEDYGSYVLHGITGSGKTRIYIEMAAKAISQDKSAIILTPEISLTSQLAARFREVFGERVVVMHSQQSPNERQAAWLTCLRSKEPLLVIGPRSALFSPVEKLGLIVIDESHESAYKQEQAPQYQTGRVAAYLSSLTRATLVLGSATPSISDYYLAEQKSKPIVHLDKLATNNEGVKDIMIIDRKDHSLFNRSSYLSQPLIEAIELALNNGEQTLLYLNRRGTARMVMCQSCGWQALCPNCDVPLTYHGDNHRLRCHSCSYSGSAPTTCPKCGQPDVMFKTAGTKAIVNDVQRLFPSARIARFDTDNTREERFERQFEVVKNGQVDILVGTQLLAKGLDLPRLSTLGVLLADTSLYMPDFSSQERTFQLITQVLGRVGRGHVAGRAVIQTYHPDHAVIKDAVAANYQNFYKRELAERQQFMFPPFCYLLKITARRASIKSAESAAARLKDEIESAGYRVRVEGPAPCFYERLQNKYQWQLVVKSRDRNELLKVVESLPAGYSYDLDPLDLL